MRRGDAIRGPRNPEVTLETEHSVKSWHSPNREAAVFEGAARVYNQ